MSSPANRRKGWWRLFVPGAGIPTALDERLGSVLPPRRARASRSVNPLGAEVDQVLAEDPSLWTEEDRRTVTVAHATIAREAQEISAAGVLPPDTLRRAYRQLLRWLILPVCMLIALHVWRSDLPHALVASVRVVCEIGLALIGVGFLVLSRGFRFHELAAAASVAGTPYAADTAVLDGSATEVNTAPRRLMDSAPPPARRSSRLTIRAVVDPPAP